MFQSWVNAEFDSNMLSKGNGGGRDHFLRPLPDNDPTDNKIRMVYAWSELGAGLSGAKSTDHGRLAKWKVTPRGETTISSTSSRPSPPSMGMTTTS